ncbi:MgtC/SapB family protein [Roseomonas hellenica]|uniref:Protein MgtC n=1 Tax=Plastoroseomonas hellenica TaxID=2687306 RepID=A0ABS5F4A0_9PROT|nr:MgtC/SapB family protein [Plastoroseomonas hellenica]MBR0667298.1 MgtC/SapB family protein [Plastoroseomonas hellenica]
MTIGLEQSALNLLAAMVLGVVIGIEREWRHPYEGLRINVLVALGSAGFVLCSQLVAGDNSPTRIAGQVVTGIGFLGAGLIFRQGGDVKGLKTAATLWCASAVGVLAGFGAFANAALLTGFVLTVNLVLRPLGRMIERGFGITPLPPDRGGGSYRLQIICDAASLPALRTALAAAVEAAAGVRLRDLEGNLLAGGTAEVKAALTVETAAATTLERILAGLAKAHPIASARWRVEMAGG